MQCPKGHQLPYKAKNGASCTTKWCGDVPFELKKDRLKSAAADPEYDKFENNTRNYERRTEKAEEQVATALDAAETVAETTKFGSDMNALLAELKRKQLNLQRTQDTIRTAREGDAPDLEGEEAVQWTKDRINKLVPSAILRIEGNLKYGTDLQKDKAAERVLDMAGFSKGEQKSGGNAPIIMLNLGGATLPWSQQPKAIDIKAMPVLPPDNAKK